MTRAISRRTEEAAHPERLEKRLMNSLFNTVHDGLSLYLHSARNRVRGR